MIRFPVSKRISRRSFLFCLALCGLAGFLLSGCGEKPAGEENASASSDDEIVIAVLPKLVNIDYFDACEKGAQKAAADLGVKLVYDGPQQPSGIEQNKFIETWIRQGVDAICIAPNQPKSIKRFVEQAQGRGIKVITWDSDAPDSGRAFMVNQVNDAVLGRMLIDDIAEQMGGSGKWAIAIASLDASNLNTWRKYAEEHAKEKYPDLELVDTVVTQEDAETARQMVQSLINANPDLKGIVAFDSNSVPGAAEAIKRANKVGEIALVGNSTPKSMKPYIKEGVLKSFYLWNPQQLGELTVRVAHALVSGKEIESGTELPKYGPIQLHPDDATTIIMSEPIRFTAENIDEYDFGI
ncbi:autoinducer 2 ABC transporter substrate-binding protein [Polystyrenella longa]|uniref:autoinducer 2 ABC transporter substrate-binding protein n=1 Tax=Polystyrenella longa TaxID=2528007 RepID=UPI0018D24BA4|nr:autoinducer 2 ABC transporter substrate-binding protein [Polystyrenella longa]